MEGPLRDLSPPEARREPRPGKGPPGGVTRSILVTSVRVFGGQWGQKH